MRPTLSELLQDPEMRKVRRARGVGNPAPRTKEARTSDGEPVNHMQRWCPSRDPAHPELGVSILNNESEALVAEWRSEQRSGRAAP